MASEPPNQGAKPNPTSLTTHPRALWSRSLAVTAAIVFCISTAFPVVAGFVKDRESWPKWWGVLDLGIAFVLAMLAFLILGLGRRLVNKEVEDISYRAYRILLHGIFAAIVVFFLMGDRIMWINCLSGFAWRTWLLLYCLPEWFALFEATVGLSGVPRK